jgi:hypothetical protein
MSDFDDDDFDDDDVVALFSSAWEIEPRPITKYTFLNFGFTLAIGLCRTVLEATSNLGDAILGAEGYEQEKKDFEDQARLAIDSIVDGEE